MHALTRKDPRLIISRMIRRSARRREVRRLRRKTSNARRVVAQTDAMLARRTPRKAP